MGDKVVSSEITRLIKETVSNADANASVILYGSRARGDAREDSDWDVVILTDAPKADLQTFMALGNPLYDLADEYGVEINPIIYNRTQWNNSAPTLFRHNVLKEGIVL